MWTLQKVLKPEAQPREKAPSLIPSQGQTVEDTVCELPELFLRCVPWCLVANHDGYPKFLGEGCISYSAYLVFSFSNRSFLSSWSVCTNTHCSACSWVSHNMQSMAEFQCSLHNMSGDVGFEVLTVLVVKSSTLWDVMSCTPVKVNQFFGGICLLTPTRLHDIVS